MRNNMDEKVRKIVDQNISAFIGDEVIVPDTDNVLEKARSINVLYDMSAKGNMQRTYGKKGKLRLSLLLSCIVIAVVLLFVSIPTVRAGIVGLFINRTDGSLSQEHTMFYIDIIGIELISMTEFANGVCSSVYQLDEYTIILTQENIVSRTEIDINVGEATTEFEIETDSGTAYCVEDPDGYIGTIINDNVRLTVYANMQEKAYFSEVVRATRMKKQ